MIRRISIFYILIISGLAFGCKSTGTSTSASSHKTPMTDGQKADITNLFFNANKEKILGNFNNAADLFSEVIRRDNNNAASMFELSNIYSNQKKFADALFFARSAWAIDPKNSWYALNYADVLQKNKRFNDAADVLSKLINDFPDRPDFYYEWASALIFADKPAEAVKVYDKLEGKIGVSKDVSMQKSRLYQRMKKNDKAIEELQKLILFDSKDAQSYGMLAEVYQSMGEKQKALDTYTKILQVDPDNSYIHLSLADYYRTEGDKERSLQELKLAFKNKDLDIDTKISILSSYYSLIELHPELKGQALELCAILIESHPNEPRTYTVYGDFLNQDKKFDEARIQYRKAIALGTKDYLVYSQILYIDSQQQEWDSLKRDSEEALNLFPEQPLVYFFNGVANIQKKDLITAVASLNSGVKLVVDNIPLETQFYSSLGDAYNELKQYDKSDENFEKAIKLNPKDANVMNNYSYYLSLRGEKLDKAEEMSRMSNQLEPTQASYQDTYAWVLYKLGRFPDAKIWIEKAIAGETKPSATLYEHYGDILFKTGDTAKAFEFWQKAKAEGEGGSEYLDRKIQEKKIFE